MLQYKKHTQLISSNELIDEINSYYDQAYDPHRYDTWDSINKIWEDQTHPLSILTIECNYAGVAIYNYMAPMLTTYYLLSKNHVGLIKKLIRNKSDLIEYYVEYYTFYI